LLGGEGVLPGLFAPVNRLAASLTHPLFFLIIAVAIGVLHIFTAMGIRIYILCKEGKVFDAIVDVGSWYLIFIGIGLIALGFTIPAAIVAGLGVLMIVLFHARDTKNPILRFLKGLLGLYDIVNYAADLMSYSRIMALGLASAVIAMVVNVLAEMVSGGWIGLIFVPLILIVGHGINIGLNLLGTYVHTSRLQYIEFFGKFYVDGGRQFKPLALHPAYTALALGETPTAKNAVHPESTDIS
jgi:V/A-type H+-transporting ATPase subunit I